MKKFTAILLIILMLSLTGCGGNSLKPTKSNEPTIVQDYNITVPLIEGDSSVELTGKYSGEILDGKPQGEGTFTVEGENDIQYVYKGSFKDGAFDGYGIAFFSADGETYERAGTYSKASCII